MSQHDILQLLQQNGRTAAYWHAAASIDLVPSQAKDSALPLHLAEGDRVELAELVAYLTGGTNIERMIISDRYYQTNLQHDLLHELTCNARCSNGVLCTLKDQYNQLLPSGWHFEYFERKHPENHDRYWLFITATGIHAWKLTTGLDFARPSDGNWHVKGYPSFTPIAESDLPKYLQALLASKTEEATV